MDTWLRTGLLILALGLGLSACSDPYADRPPTDPRSRLSTSPRVPAAVPGPAAGDARPAEPAPARPLRGRRPAEPSPERLARAYARDAINWDWRTLAHRLVAQRRLTSGALSAELEEAIAATRADESLERDRPASRGAVVAVAVTSGGRRQRLVVVTREQETAGGAEPLAPATHRVYLGRARRFDGGWQMVAWRRAP